MTRNPLTVIRKTWFLVDDVSAASSRSHLYKRSLALFYLYNCLFRNRSHALFLSHQYTTTRSTIRSTVTDRSLRQTVCRTRCTSDVLFCIAKSQNEPRETKERRTQGLERLCGHTGERRRVWVVKLAEKTGRSREWNRSRSKKGVCETLWHYVRLDGFAVLSVGGKKIECTCGLWFFLIIQCITW